MPRTWPPPPENAPRTSPGTPARRPRLKLDIAAEKANAKDAYAEVGRLFFDATDKKNVPEPYIRAFDSVMLANAAVERLEAELEELRAVVNESGEPVDVSFVCVVEEAARGGAGDVDEDAGEGITVEITVEKEPGEDAPQE